MGLDRLGPAGTQCPTIAFGALGIARRRKQNFDAFQARLHISCETVEKVMKNLTLAIDESLLDEVRVAAAKKGTTVNAMVRDYLVSVAKLEDRKDRARRRIRELAEKSTAEVGSITWKREDLYDR
jgi:hypothetical protein